MPNNSDFLALEAQIRGLDQKTVVHPNMPPGVFIQEAEDLHAWARNDLPQLVARGLEQAYYDSIPQRAGAMRFTQSEWNSTRFTREEAQAQFQKLAPEAYDFKALLIHEMLFAYRNHPDLKSRVQAIAEGSGDADMIQDLSDLSVHGKNNPEPLVAIGFEMSQLDRAASMSDELASLLGVARGEKAQDSEAKVLRDRAYTLLKQAVDEVRAVGQFVFWRDEKRSVGYASDYHRHQRRTQSNKADATSSDIGDAP